MCGSNPTSHSQTDLIMQEELKKLDEILSRKLSEEYRRHSDTVKAIWEKYRINKERIESKGSSNER